MPKKLIKKKEEPKAKGLLDGTETVLRKSVDIYDEQYLMNMRQIGYAFAVTPDVVAKWHVKPVIKKGKSVYYYLPEVIKYRMGDSDTPKINPAQAKARLDDARREAVELELAKKKGDLLSVEEVRKVMEHDYMIVRQRLLALPTKVARLVNPETPQKAYDILYKSVCDSLRDLTHEITSQEDNAPSGESTIAAPEVNPSGMGGQV